MKLLVISNGHGEDIIAVKIILALQSLTSEISISALPMVGEGFAYQQQQIPIISTVKKMPSGGFIYMDNQQLWQDIRHGLIGLSLSQYQTVKTWAKQGNFILAVGDILPLLLAYISGVNYSFIGTAKSEYYLRNETQWLPHTNFIERWWGSDYYPWEYWLMKHSRCLGVFPRDSLTAKILEKKGVSAYDCGNPMMDDLEENILSSQKSVFPLQNTSFLKILLLPGSRLPEAQNNWNLILSAVDNLLNSSFQNLIFLSAIAPSLCLSNFTEYLKEKGWQKGGEKPVNIRINDPDQMVFTKQGTVLILTKNIYAQCLQYCDMCIGMAGTATEQFVGLGKPVIAFAGEGPQYNQKFAENQKRLLGVSLQLVDNPMAVGQKLEQLLCDNSLRQSIYLNGKQRLGNSGAAKKIAFSLLNRMLPS